MKIGNSPGNYTTTAKALRQAKVKARSKASSNASSVLQTSSTKKSNSSGKSAIAASVRSAELKKNFNVIKDTADHLQAQAAKLPTDAENKEKAVTEISSFIKDYNSLIETMNDTDETVDKLYLKQMKSFASENKIALKELGITQESDGTLTVDQKVLKAAEPAKLQKVFGTKNSFIEKVTEKSKDVEANANIQLASLNKSYTYNQSGYISSGYNSGGSLYNTKG